MKLRFTQQALHDIAEIADHIRIENPPAAERVRASIVASLETLLLFPYLGRLQSLENIRKLVTRKYRYVVYYVADVGAGEIAVLAIRHPARDRIVAGD